KPSLFVTSALAVFALLLTACTSASETVTPAPATTAAPALASPTRAAAVSGTSVSGAAAPQPTLGPRVKLKVSYPDGGGHSVVQYAFEKGIYSKYNLDVELAGLGGGSPAMAALISGETQIADITGSTVVGAVAGGADVVITGIL